MNISARSCCRFKAQMTFLSQVWQDHFDTSRELVFTTFFISCWWILKYAFLMRKNRKRAISGNENRENVNIKKCATKCLAHVRFNRHEKIRKPINELAKNVIFKLICVASNSTFSAWISWKCESHKINVLIYLSSLMSIM